MYSFSFSPLMNKILCRKENLPGIMQQKKLRYKWYRSHENQSSQSYCIVLLSSRLYCRFWNFTKSAVYTTSCSAAHLCAHGSRTIPPVGTFTRPRRLYSFYKNTIPLSHTDCKHLKKIYCFFSYAANSGYKKPVHLHWPQNRGNRIRTCDLAAPSRAL